MKDRVGRRFDNAKANCANFSADLASVEDSESITRVQGIPLHFDLQFFLYVQPADIGWPTGNGKKLSKSQACCLAQLCLATA